MARGETHAVLLKVADEHICQKRAGLVRMADVLEGLGSVLA
jgi:hypothetical protein